MADEIERKFLLEEPPGWSRDYSLKGKERADEGIRRIALGRAEHALEKLEDAGGDELAASIHSARKDLKKLRAVLRLVRGELGKKLFKGENRRYRDAGRRLARSRDAEVKLATLVGLGERFEGDLPREDTRRWKEALEQERDRLSDASREETQRQIEAAAAAIEAGRVEMTRWPLRTDSWELIRAGLGESYRRGRRARRQTLDESSAENVHEWRKCAKDLWYQLRIVRNAWPELLGETAEQAHELADLLGDHHDLAVLAEDLAGRDELEDREAFEASIQRRQGELLTGALGLGRRLYAEKPKAFSRRIEAYWSAWRD